MSIVDVDVNVKQMLTATIVWPVLNSNVSIRALVSAVALPFATLRITFQRARVRMVSRAIRSSNAETFR